MAQTNYTPIQLYYSTTASAAPTSGNLLSGELAINILDGKLFYKDNGGTVQVIATKGSGTIGGSDTQVQFNDAGTLGGSSGFIYNKTTTTATISTLNLTNALGVAYGGTGLTAGTSGGVLYYSATGVLASSAALAASSLVVGGGAGAAPATTTTGTGVVTALGVNTGSAGAFVVNGGALGTPSSGTVTNLTGTASININGTVGATTANTGAFSTVSATGVITSTVATGTAPFTVASTTQVANLNAATAGNVTGTVAVANGGTGLTSGTSGGVLYYSAAGTLASSAALSANAIVLGGGAGATPATTTTGTGVVTALGNNANATGGFATIDGTATLTNKRINPRTSSTASTATLTPDISANDQYNLTAQAVGLTVAAPTGTPVDGNKLIIRILDNGTGQTISWNATYTVIGVTLPTTTTANKMVYVGCIYNSTNTRWDVVAVATQA